MVKLVSTELGVFVQVLAFRNKCKTPEIAATNNARSSGYVGSADFTGSVALVIAW